MENLQAEKRTARHRSERIQLELTPAEAAALKIWANSQGLKVSPAVRAALYRLGAFEMAARAAQE